MFFVWMKRNTSDGIVGGTLWTVPKRILNCAKSFGWSLDLEKCLARNLSSAVIVISSRTFNFSKESTT